MSATIYIGSNNLYMKTFDHMVPDYVWEEYNLDQIINDRGIKVDKLLVEKAIEIDRIAKNDITNKLVNLTGLDNPNSVMQMKSWLTKHGLDMETLGKKDVAKEVETAPNEIKEVLKLRLQLAKSSVKKYQAMEASMCRDARCHGMFMFYGANRSGRWAGRIVQLQNLPQNHMKDLEEARAIVKSGDYETLNMLYDNVPNVLSELIRTSFIPRDGYKFIVSDFSAIEARVLSYLAGKTWRSEVFKNNGDIYCASASQMFHVPVEKHGINGHLR